MVAIVTEFDDQGRPRPPDAGDEASTLMGFLDFQRATFAWKCDGVDAAGLAATVGASTMTLGGMRKHLALVEDWWFNRWLAGRPSAMGWDDVDWDADPDWEWHSAVHDSPDELARWWNEAVARSRDCVTAALLDGDLGQLAKRRGPEGEAPSLRWIFCHMIEEYARHNGHADLLREFVDGATGE